MLKENYYNSLLLLFCGLSIIYMLNTPPTIIVKYPKIDGIKNVNYMIEADNMFLHSETCDTNTNRI